MPKEEFKSQFAALRLMFLSGSVKRMKDIEKLYPTAVAKNLRINHSRYIHKLYHPEEFSIKQLMVFATLLDLELRDVLEVIIKQVSSNSKPAKKK